MRHLPHPSPQAPTFALLCEKRRLHVCNPESGVRFTITLRDWQALLWAVRVHPARGWRQPHNAYTTAHRIMPRPQIGDWLAHLQLWPAEDGEMAQPTRRKGRQLGRTRI